MGTRPGLRRVHLPGWSLRAAVTVEALDYLDSDFVGSDVTGARLAGRAEESVGDPEQVSDALAAMNAGLLMRVRA
jgi:hypothetical protein